MQFLFFKNRSQPIIKASIVLVSFVVVLGVFLLGIFVGYRKAEYSFRWEENYERNFGGPEKTVPQKLSIHRAPVGTGYMNAHGMSATVLKVDDHVLVVTGRDNIEKTVLVSGQTRIQKGRTPLSVSEVKPDDQLVVIGAPTREGSIEARLIRIFQK